MLMVIVMLILRSFERRRGKRDEREEERKRGREEWSPISSLIDRKMRTIHIHNIYSFDRVSRFILH
jgi:SET domain-containing protein